MHFITSISNDGSYFAFKNFIPAALISSMEQVGKYEKNSYIFTALIFCFLYCTKRDNRANPLAYSD